MKKSYGGDQPWMSRLILEEHGTLEVSKRRKLDLRGRAVVKEEGSDGHLVHRRS